MNMENLTQVVKENRTAIYNILTSFESDTMDTSEVATSMIKNVLNTQIQTKLPSDNLTQVVEENRTAIDKILTSFENNTNVTLNLATSIKEGLNTQIQTELPSDNLTQVVKVVKENRNAINMILDLWLNGTSLNSTTAKAIKTILETKLKPDVLPEASPEQIGGKKRKSTKKRKSIKKRKSTKRRRPIKKRR